MESDQDDRKSRNKSSSNSKADKDLNMSHEDLSDVSDLDSGHEDGEKESKVKRKQIIFQIKIPECRKYCT